ncbi:MAG: protease PrsW [Patescibacteria group bacterium]|nr:protease PrsW [Patescibacteria group bacterium]
MKVSILLFAYLLVVVFPVLFWFWYFREKDRDEPEPKRLLLKTFLFGIVVSLIAGVIEIAVEGAAWPNLSGIDDLFYQSTPEVLSNSPEVVLAFLFTLFLAGPIEETLKYLGLRAAVYKKEAFNQIGDGIIYGVSTALGFSFAENSFYFYDIFQEYAYSIDFFSIVFARGVLATFLHITAAGIVGLYLGRAKFSSSGKKILILKGLAIASFVHGAYNIMAIFPYGAIVDAALVFLLLGFLLHRMKKADARMVWRRVA